MAAVKYARWGDRWAAVAIDHIILTILLVVLFLIIGGVQALITLPTIILVSLGLTAVLGPEGFGLFLLAFAEWLVYFTVFEGITGQTLGKREAGIRVLDPLTLKPVGIGRAAERNLLRILDWLPIFYILGLILAIRDEKRRRLGTVWPIP
jgi:uncharacterized RDD family membrane protein YckC